MVYKREKYPLKRPDAADQEKLFVVYTEMPNQARKVRVYMSLISLTLI